MSGHTPGPWVDHEGEIYQAGSDEFHVATIVDANRNADVVLMAAAPDMLQALRMLLQAYGPSSGWSQGARDAWEAAEAAVAKAEGR
jgi:hypothetical protein